MISRQCHVTSTSGSARHVTQRDTSQSCHDTCNTRRNWGRDPASLFMASELFNWWNCAPSLLQTYAQTQGTIFMANWDFLGGLKNYLLKMKLQVSETTSIYFFLFYLLRWFKPIAMSTVNISIGFHSAPGIWVPAWLIFLTLVCCLLLLQLKVLQHSGRKLFLLIHKARIQTIVNQGDMLLHNVPM